MNVALERPLLLAFGLAALALVLIFSRLWKKDRALSLPLGPPGGQPFKAPAAVDALVRVLRALDLVGIVALLIAAAGPFFISYDTLWMNRGADVLFILDISPSMSGIDMEGKSRFDAARSLVGKFAAHRRTDAIGLVGVGADAALLVPATVDRKVLLDRLEGLRIGELGDGTALGTALALAALHLKDSTAPKRAAVLITDGENNAGALNPLTAAAALRSVGASLWVIGVGTAGQVPLDYVDPVTRIRRTGTFESRFDPETFRAIARAGSGVYLPAPSADSFAAAFSALDGAEATVQRSRTVKRSAAFHRPFILAALLLLVGSRFVRRSILGALL